MSEVAVILIAIVAAVLAFRFIAGMVKLAVLALIVVAAVYFLGFA